MAEELPAPFIEDVASFLKDKDVETAIRQLQDTYSRLQMQESRLLQQRVKLQNKLPEIQRALECVKLLLTKQASGEATSMDFQLVDTVFAKAVLQDTSSVCLWLGANVMLEYELQEAHDLLARNYDNARTSLESIKRDMLNLRDSITTTEVSIARVYNDDVRRRRAAGAVATRT